MGILRSLRNLLRVQHDDPQREQRLGYLAPMGVPVTLETALRVSALYACVSRIAKSVAASPVSVYSFDGRRRELLPADNVAYMLNTRANPEQGAEKVRNTISMWAALTGNGYAEIQRDGAGRPAALWPLFSTRMEVCRQDGELLYEYHPTYGGVTVLPAADVFHLAGPGLGQLGDDVVHMAAQALALSMAAERFTLAYFQNGTHLGGFLEMPGKLQGDTRKGLEEDFKAANGGSNNAFRTIVLEGGMKFVQLQVKASEAQVAELRDFQLQEVARFFDVPLLLLQNPEGAQGYGTNIASLWDVFTKTCVKPWAVRWQQEIDAKLFATRGPWRKSEVDLSWLTRGNALERAQAYEVMRRIGVDSANDILEQEGRNSIGPEGDVRLVPNTFTTVEGIQKQIEQIGKKPPPAPPPSGPKEPTPEPPPSDALAREAILALVTGTGERYARRLANRRADLEKRGLPGDQIATNLEQERARARDRLAQDCAPVWPLAERLRLVTGTVQTLADAIDAGRQLDECGRGFLGLATPSQGREGESV